MMPCKYLQALNHQREIIKTVTYGKHSLRFLGPQLWSKLSKEERNIATLATFRTMIRKKDVTSFLEGCGSECRLCLD